MIQPTSLSQDSHAFFIFKFEEGFAECCHNLPKELLEQCRQYFENHCSLLNSVDGPRIVHRDFRPGNILVLDGKIQGIIDWSSARSSFAEEDFCPLEQGEWTIHDAVRQSFLKGYSRMRPVPDYNTVMPLLALSRTFATLGFIIKHGLWQTSHACLYQTCRRFLETFI